MTTFDDVYAMFISITSVDNLSLPATDGGKYELIDSARRFYNVQLFSDVQQNNLTETFDRELSDAQITVFCHCMSYIIYKNMQTEFASMISMASKDNAIKDYKAQTEIRSELVQAELETIQRLKITLMEYTEE